MDFSNDAPASPNGIPCVAHWRSKLLPSAFTAPLPMMVLPMIRLGLFLFGDGLGQGGANLVRVVAVDGGHAPAPGLIFLGGILVRDGAGVRGELDIVGIVEHDQVAQAEEPGDAARSLRDLFLHAPVRNEGKGLVRHPFAEAGAEEPFGNGGAHRAGVALAQRPGGVLHPAADIQFGVAGRGAAPLAEVLQLIERVVSAQRQHRVEHRRHVARIQEEPVPHVPGRVRGIVAQEFGVKDIDEIGPAHRPSRMPGLGLLDHGGGEDADIVGGSINDFIMHVVGRGLLDSRDNYQAQLAAARFAIDFDHSRVSMVDVMRAPLRVVNERRQQQVAGLSQAHPPVRPERAVSQGVRVAARR